MGRWASAFQIAAVYVGTVVGAGFATGKEIVEFFTRFGVYGCAMILAGGGVFIIMGTKLMSMAIDIQAQSYEEMNSYLFGQVASKVINGIMMLMLIGVCAVMLSGAGAVFEEHLGLPRTAGLAATILLTYIVMMGGIKGLFAVNVAVVPVMIGFNLLLSAAAVYDGAFIHLFMDVPDDATLWQAGMRALSYAAFNLALAQAVLVPVAAQVNDKAAVRLGGILGGVLLTIILLSSHIALLTLQDLQLHAIPIAVLVKRTLNSIYYIYLFIIYGEIFTSIIGNLYGLEMQIKKYWQARRTVIHACLLTVIYMISRVEYGKLLGYLYPAFGYASLLFLVLLFTKRHKPGARL